MTVGQLKKLISGLPDGTPVVVSAPDHHYREAGARKACAVPEDPDFGEDPCDGSATINVLLVS